MVGEDAARAVAVGKRAPRDVGTVTGHESGEMRMRWWIALAVIVLAADYSYG